MKAIEIPAPNGDLFICELDERWEAEGTKMTGWDSDVNVLRKTPAGDWDEVAAFETAIEIDLGEGDPESIATAILSGMAAMWPNMPN